MRGGAVALVTLLGATPAFALVGDSFGDFGLDARLSTTAIGVRNYDFPPFFGEGNELDGSSQTLLRAMAAGRPRGDLRYELHGFAALQAATAGGAATSAGESPFGVVPSSTRYRALDLEVEPLADGDASVLLGIDRAALTGSLGRIDVTLGRQAITFGKTFFWNPLDPFLAFDPRQFDRDFKPGVDALRVDVALGDFSGLSFVGVAGRTLDASGAALETDTLDASWLGSALLGRATTHVAGWDLELQGGKVYGGAQVGGGTVGELGPVEVRFEATHLFADEARSPRLSPLSSEPLVESGTVAALGVGHRFESSLTLELETLWNDLGDPDALEASLVRFANGLSFHLSRHVVGALASYEVTPLAVAQLVWLTSADDGSGQVQPTLSYSISDEAELVAGATLGYGPRPRQRADGSVELRSEFGSFPDYYFVQFEVYF